MLETAQFGGDVELLAPVHGDLVEERPAGADVVPPDSLADGGGPGEARASGAPFGLSREGLGRGGSSTPSAHSSHHRPSREGGSDTVVSSISQGPGEEPSPSGSTRSTLR
ncbi:hypothetical protein GCM10023238_19860 [Streptomyces heliomycini]